MRGYLQVIDEGQQKSGCFSGAGLSRDEEIEALTREGNGFGLHENRRTVAGLFDRFEKR